MITKTWFNQSSVVNMDNYVVNRRDRVNSIGGGVCCYIKDSIVSFEVDDQILNSNCAEQL